MKKNNLALKRELAKQKTENKELKNKVASLLRKIARQEEKIKKLTKKDNDIEIQVKDR